MLTQESRHGPARGFSLVELAVVLTIVALALASLMYTLSAQIEQRNFEDTRRRLEQARELLLASRSSTAGCPALRTAHQRGRRIRRTAGAGE